MNALPSRAYDVVRAVSVSSVHAIVASIPRVENFGSLPTLLAANYQVELSGTPAGLVGNWRFNDGAGSTAADSAGSPQNLTLQGGAAFSPIDRAPNH